MDSWLNCTRCGDRYKSFMSSCPRCGYSSLGGGNFKKTRTRTKSLSIAVGIVIIVVIAVSLSALSILPQNNPHFSDQSAHSDSATANVSANSQNGQQPKIKNDSTALANAKLQDLKKYALAKIN